MFVALQHGGALTGICYASLLYALPMLSKKSTINARYDGEENRCVVRSEVGQLLT